MKISLNNFQDCENSKNTNLETDSLNISFNDNTIKSRCSRMSSKNYHKNNLAKYNFNARKFYKYELNSSNINSTSFDNFELNFDCSEADEMEKLENLVANNLETIEKTLPGLIISLIIKNSHQIKEDFLHKFITPIIGNLRKPDGSKYKVNFL